MVNEPAAVHTIELWKKSLRRLNADKLQIQVKAIIDRSMAGNRQQRGWHCEIGNPAWMKPRFVDGGEYRYTCKLNFTCTPRRERTPEAIALDWNNIIKIIAKSGAKPGWEVATIDNKIADTKADDRLPKSIGYVPVEIPANWAESFTHIYERDSQIDIIMSAINAGINSNFYDRFHCALIGAPACGKTETLRGIKNVLGEDAVLEYDATATTQAGAIQDLNDREELPRVLIVEEIEKTDENSLRWLLSVMDHRAEIRKLTARSNIQKETKMLTLATVNDYNLFRKIMFGALASRFTYHLHFPLPNRNLLHKILEREVDRVRGNRRWIKAALDYAISEEIYDPRKVTAICLCGRDQLLSGEYQEKLKSCSANSFLRELRQRKDD